MRWSAPIVASGRGTRGCPGCGAGSGERDGWPWTCSAHPVPQAEITPPTRYTTRVGDTPNPESLLQCQKFLVLFNRLKSELNNSLKNLKWLPNAKPEIAELCFQLDETYRQLNRIFADQPTKYSFVPAVFQKRWDEYINYYQEKVSEAANPLKEKYERELVELFR